MSEERSLQRFPIEQLGGVNRNLADGLGTAPDELKNLRFTRAGGWQFYGAVNDGPQLPGHSGVDTVTITRDKSGYYVWRVGGAGHPGYLFNGGSVVDFGTIVGATADPVVSYTPYTGLVISHGVTAQEYYARMPSGVFSVVEASHNDVSIALGSGTGFSGNLRFAFIHYVQTAMGKVLFHPKGSTFADDILLSATEESIEISRQPSAAGTLVYLKGQYRYGGTEELPGWTPSLGNRFIADFPPSETTANIEITDDSELMENSHIWLKRILATPRADPVEHHQGRYYYSRPAPLASGASTDPWYGPGSRDSQTRANLVPPLGSGPEPTVIYFTELNFANLSRTLNYFNIPFSASRTVTALLSTPAGLLIAGENEMFLLRGDPEAQPELTRFSSSIGSDFDVRAVSMGGIVFVAYAGHIYMLSLGMGDIDFGSGIDRVSDDIYDVEDEFKQLAVDHELNILVARTESGKIFHFDVARRAWFEGGLSEMPDFFAFLPNPGVLSGSPIGDGPIYLSTNGQTKTLELGGSGSARFGFEQLDFGDKRARKLFRSAEINVSDEYNPGSPPVMEYAVDGRSGSVNGSNLGEGRWVFRLPLGSSGAKADFAFSFSGLTVSDVIEPPIVFNVVPLGRRRI